MFDESRYAEFNFCGLCPCWGLVTEVYSQEKGIALPATLVDARDALAVVKEFKNNPALSLFEESQRPEELDVVGMCSQGDERKSLLHVGLWLPPDDTLKGLHGYVFHVIADQGIYCTPIKSVADYGYQVTGIHRYKSK